MENFAKKIAIDHKITGKSSMDTFPIQKLVKDFECISATNSLLNQCITLNVAIPPSGEWLLDNYYLIEEQVNYIKNELKLSDYLKLPAIQDTARVLILAKEFVTFTDGYITKENIEVFLNAYQTNRAMEMREIWQFSIMLKIALIEYIARISERMIVSQYQKLKVESLVERLVKKVPQGKQQFSKYKNLEVDSEASTYVEHLTFLLKRLGKEGISYLEVLEDEVKKVGTTVLDVIKMEHDELTLKRVSMGNSITSLRRIGRLNWNTIFENTNKMDTILRQDPWYDELDYDTKALYRNCIQKIAADTNISEIYIANKLIALSCKTSENKLEGEEEKSKTHFVAEECGIEEVVGAKIPTSTHIGEYLIGERKKELYEALGFRYHIVKHKLLYYLLAIYFPTLMVSYALLKENFWIAFIPVSQIFVSVMDKLIIKKIMPRKLPCMEKVKDDVHTFVIVPTLLTSEEQVKSRMANLEVYYLANREENLLFALLGDASESLTEKMPYDEAIIQMGISEAKRLNEKYQKEIFFFLYRKRVFQKGQGKWLGYERKRGMIMEFNEFLLTREPGTFLANTIHEIPKIKYVITLDADTELTIESAKKLIGTMEHPMNQPVVKNGVVVKGYGIIEPRVGVSIKASTASLFSKIYAGSGGLDVYSTMEPNVYQDVFGEAVFTGKGIYHLEVFQSILKTAIPENKVLSHDLLEGSYLRCGLASDIEVIDGFPARVNSYMVRKQRWIRGDWQIVEWLFKKPLSGLSKYKILDNLRRSLVDVFTFLLMLTGHINTALFVVFSPVLIDVLDKVLNMDSFFRKTTTKSYLPLIGGLKGSLYRSFLNLLFVPYQFICTTETIIKTLYRVFVSKKNLLEWLTAEEAEKTLGKDLKSFVLEMGVSFLLGLVLVLQIALVNPMELALAITLAFLWFLTPFVAYGISLPEKRQKDRITKEEENFLRNVAEKTWKFFATYMREENHYLPPDNYQENRKNEVVSITSSTNIGLGLMAILSANDLKMIDNEEAMDWLEKCIGTIEKLDKWHGHLYNWYQIKTLEPLNPKFVSTVDSGNLAGYLYTIKEYLYEKIEKYVAVEKSIENARQGNKVAQDKADEEQRKVLLEKERVEKLYAEVSKLINDMDFSKLFDESKNLFSIGYDVKENCLLDSYYDLLASEARQASFVAIAKRDVPYKHWFNLGRSLTTLNSKKGLISWSGTMFEYFMPSIIMENFQYTLLDETYDFCIYSQKEYAKRLKIPWGISESAFNLLDLNYNYQYKAFGIPWLGVKRGLKDEIVISPYSSILTLSKNPNAVLKNMYWLEKMGAYQKYGFYEAIDYTNNRLNQNDYLELKGEKLSSNDEHVPKNRYTLVKTYMAHHQGLILTSINNFLNHEILVSRFSKNPEMKAASVLLQERVPQNIVYTNEKKEKVKTIKYHYYEEYSEMEVPSGEQSVNILANENVTLFIDNSGNGYSKWKGKMLNRYKTNNEQTNFFYLKNLNNKECWSNFYSPNMHLPEDYCSIFSSAICKYMRKDGDIVTTTKICISPEEDVEIRLLEIENTSKEEVDMDIVSYFEPILCDKDTDITFPSFNKLFLFCERYQNAVLVEKRERNPMKKNTMLLLSLFENADDVDFAVETDKLKILGACHNVGDALIKKQDRNYKSEISLSTDAVISFKKNRKLKPGEKIKLHFVMAILEDKEKLEEFYQKVINPAYFDRTFELAISKSVVENRFLGFRAQDIMKYNQIIAKIEQGSATRKKYEKRIRENKLKQRDLWKFGISGELPILLVKIKNPSEIEMIRRLMKAMEYYRHKNIMVDFVIIDEERNSYDQYTLEKIYESINSKNLSYMLNINGGIHIIKLANISYSEMNLLYSCSDMILDAHSGILEEQIV